MKKMGIVLNKIRWNKIISGLFLFIVFFVCHELSGQTSDGTVHNFLQKDFYNGSDIRITFLKENIIRIQLITQGGKFNETGLNRYGFIQDLNTGQLNVNISRLKNGFSAETSRLKIKGNGLTGEIVVTDPQGKKILLKQIDADLKQNSGKVVFRADKSENWIGFGDQSRERLYHRGFIADCYVRNVKSYIPVPFFMSTLGVGVLVNTTKRIVFDMCKSDTDRYSWSDESGNLDYYVIVGEGYHELLDSYTELTGKPKLPPEWAFGLWYVCRTQANDYEAVNDALNFRREGIPCDVIGLEPGWMEKDYDFSTMKKWNNQRFPIPYYALNGPYNFINSIKRMGFKVELWLCNDYDLTHEEERRINRNKAGSFEKHPKVGGVHDLEVDEHLAQPKYLDNMTKREEPWFDHLKKFVDQGIDFFKQDGANQVNDHPDRLWGNGMPDAEIHNLYPLLYARQMYEGFKTYTNRRPVVFTPCGWTGFQSWAGTWTGDTGGRLATLGAMLNTSIIGHAWSTNDMEVTQKEGIHFGYLQPWSQINSWNYFRMPWIQGAELLAMHKYYGQLRSRLIPYLYSWANYSTKTGWPMLVPLTLEFPDDNNCRENLHQYLLGRDLMVGIYNRDMYFPAGKWKDYWTGEVITGLQEKKITWPDDRGGSLYIRSGGIVPFGPVMQYRGEKPMNEVTLYIFPDEKESAFDLYEDDGFSFEHLKGKYSITRISAKIENNESVVTIGATEGDFDGKAKDRIWKLVMHCDKKPVSVSYNDKLCPREDYSWDEIRKEVTMKGIIVPVVAKIKN
ncbi:MAG: DUF5110 domain-containing protein [Prolixibacteraceae bacterium]|jgi:alpha-glucosidase (family GH31 glycosyl hydrolase)|nr:DUF5110 domain-containing protein [Prolixibacteraceae bacterium]